MPVLPRLETSQSVFNDAPLQSQQVSAATPESFGGIEAQAAGRLAQGAQQGSDQLAQAGLRQLDLQRETNANNQYANSFSPALRDIYTKYYALQGKDAVDQRPAFQQQIMDLQNQQREQLQDPVAQHMFDQVSTRRTQMELDGMSRYADAQNKVYQQQASDGMVKSFQQTAADRWNDPVVFDGMMKSIEAERMAHAASTGQPIEYARAQIAKDQSEAWGARITNMALTDPIGAQKMYQENIHSIEPTARYGIGRMLDTAVNSQYASVDGSVAYANAMGQASGPTIPKDYGAPTVKPYDQQHIEDIAAAVKKPSAYDDIFDRVGAKYNIPPNELKMRAIAESGLDPNAVSSQGAVGIAQITPDTAKTLGVDPKDPEQAIDGMARLMVKAQSASNGDKSAVDRAYYGGSTTARGPNTDQYVENMAAVRNRVMGQAPAPLDAEQVQARESDVLLQARAIAEQRRPGDAVYADHVAAEAQKNWARQLQAVRSRDSANMSTVLDAVVKGGVQSIGEMPETVKQTYAQLPARDMLSVQSVLREQQRAASGEFTPSDPKVFNDTMSRINLPSGDPNRITDPTQITPMIAHGLNYTDAQRLITQMKELNSPEANPFLKTTNQVKQTAQRMISANLQIAAHPEIGQEAAYRFGFALDSQIAAMRKAGKDPQTLFDPTSPEYVLKPERVMSFLPSNPGASGGGARQNTVQPQGVPARMPGEAPEAYLARTGVN